MVRLITAASHLATLITEAMDNSKQFFPQDIKYYEEAEMAAKSKKKSEIDRLVSWIR